MISVQSKRLIPTPGNDARKYFHYVQEIGTLTSKSPHISTRKNIHSFLFFVVEKGSGFFTYDNRRLEIHTGDCIFIDCHTSYSHESSKEDPWTLSWVHFYGKNLPEYYAYFKSGGYSYHFHPSDTSPILSLLNNLYSEQEKKSVYCDILSHKYLTDLVTFCFTENSPMEKTESMQNKLQDIRNYMENNFFQKISLDNLAEQFFISKYHLAREYKKYYGATLIHDLNNIRISKAKSLLRFTSKSMDEIATECGFSDAAYFIKVFKTVENITPHAYRKLW